MQRWKETDLSTLTTSLQQKALQILEFKSSRGHLIQETRNFKQLPDTEKLQQWKSLLKLYQLEIDSVQKNYSFVEKSFLEVYKTLVDLPDFHLVVQEYDALEGTLKEYKGKEVALQGQIAQLQEDIANLKQSTNHDQVDDLQLRLQEKESEWQQVLEERSAVWKEAEHALNRQIEQLTSQIQSLSAQQQLAQEHLVDRSSEIQSKLSAKVSEAEMLASELARLKGELAIAHRENKELADKLQSGHAMSEIAQYLF